MYMKNQFKKQFPSFLLETRNCFSLLSSYIIFQYISLQEHQYNLMIPVSKGQKAVRACTIRLLNLGHAKYEVQNIQWMFVLHRPKRSVDSSDLRSKSADMRIFGRVLCASGTRLAPTEVATETLRKLRSSVAIRVSNECQKTF